MKNFLFAIAIILTTLTSGLIIGVNVSQGLTQITQSITNLVSK